MFWKLMAVAAALTASEAIGAARFPPLPSTPSFDPSSYPSCVAKREWTSQATKPDKYQVIQGCIDDLERYNTYVLLVFPRRVRDFTIKVNIVEANFRRSGAPSVDKQAFVQFVQRILSQVASIDRRGLFGEAYTTYYMSVDRYQKDQGRLRMLVRNLVG